jgi:hypothetical protein
MKAVRMKCEYNIVITVTIITVTTICEYGYIIHTQRARHEKKNTCKTLTEITVLFIMAFNMTDII